jgi:hypothetical protein
MSSSFRNDAITMYLRPIEYQPDFQIYNAANVMYKQGRFETMREALNYVLHQKKKHPWKFKQIMSDYYSWNDPMKRFPKKRDVNSYQTSNTNFYGDEGHMWFCLR